jgi:hypothetical protein
MITEFRLTNFGPTPFAITARRTCRTYWSTSTSATASGSDVDRRSRASTCCALCIWTSASAVPTSGQDYSRRLVVGNLLVGERIAHVPPPPPPPSGTHTERAWFAADDPVPAIIMLVRGIRPVAAMIDNWNNWRR